jgi:hypothetical protein
VSTMAVGSLSTSFAVLLILSHIVVIIVCPFWLYQ